MRYLLGKPTSNKAWAMEVALDLCLLVFNYSMITMIDVFVKVVTFHGPLESFDFARELKETPHIFTFIPLVSFVFRIWNYFPIVYFLRIKNRKNSQTFKMKNLFCIIAVCWLACYAFVFTVIGLMGNRNLVESLASAFGVFALSDVIGPGLTASLLAPIFTYRLIGYCFDSDFSLPPWSHGRWGFGKPAPAPVPATTPASSNETGPNASPPTSTGGGG